jgi:hypothetical protein
MSPSPSASALRPRRLLGSGPRPVVRLVEGSRSRSAQGRGPALRVGRWDLPSPSSRNGRRVAPARSPLPFRGARRSSRSSPRSGRGRAGREEVGRADGRRGAWPSRSSRNGRRVAPARSPLPLRGARRSSRSSPRSGRGLAGREEVGRADGRRGAWPSRSSRNGRREAPGRSPPPPRGPRRSSGSSPRSLRERSVRSEVERGAGREDLRGAPGRAGPLPGRCGPRPRSERSVMEGGVERFGDVVNVGFAAGVEDDTDDIEP